MASRDKTRSSLGLCGDTDSPLVRGNWLLPLANGKRQPPLGLRGTQLHSHWCDAPRLLQTVDLKSPALATFGLSDVDGPATCICVYRWSAFLRRGRRREECLDSTPGRSRASVLSHRLAQ